MTYSSAPFGLDFCSTRGVTRPRLTNEKIVQETAKDILYTGNSERPAALDDVLLSARRNGKSISYVARRSPARATAAAAASLRKRAHYHRSISSCGKGGSASRARRTFLEEWIVGAEIFARN